MKKRTRIIITWLARAGLALALMLALAASLGPARAGDTTGSNDKNWLKDPITGCAVWTEKAAGKEAVSWSGGCQDGKASGQGRLLNCLEKNDSQVSWRCKQALKDVGLK